MSTAKNIQYLTRKTGSSFLNLQSAALHLILDLWFNLINENLKKSLE